MLKLQTFARSMPRGYLDSYPEILPVVKNELSTSSSDEVAKMKSSNMSHDASATEPTFSVNPAERKAKPDRKKKISIGRMFLVMTVIAIMMRPLRLFWDAGGPVGFVAGFADPWIYVVNNLMGASFSRIPIRSYGYGEFGDFFQLFGWIAGGLSVVLVGLFVAVGFWKWWKVTQTKPLTNGHHQT